MDRHVGREFSTCVLLLLFCFGDDFRPIRCVIEEGWAPLERFKPIIEKAVKKFGVNEHLYRGVVRFFKSGGLDMMPEPGLLWLQEIVFDRKQDKDFWHNNGDDTVELLKLVLARTGSVSVGRTSGQYPVYD